MTLPSSVDLPASFFAAREIAVRALVFALGSLPGVKTMTHQLSTSVLWSPARIGESTAVAAILITESAFG